MFEEFAVSLIWGIKSVEKGNIIFNFNMTGYNESGDITGIDIDNCKNKVNLDEIILNKIPAKTNSITA